MERSRKRLSIPELLVAIAIVAILALILFPVFKQRQGLTQQATCLSNLQQIGQASLLYAQDWDETMPPGLQTAATSVANPCGTTGPNVFIELLFDQVLPYLANAQVLQCPAAPQAVDLCADLADTVSDLGGTVSGIRATLGIVGNYRYTSYAFNYDLFGVGGLEADGYDLSQIYHSQAHWPYPAAIAAIEYPADTASVYDGYFVFSATTTPAIPRHSQAANVAYVDGHAAPFSMAQTPAADVVVDVDTGLPINPYYIATGPYRGFPNSSKLTTAYNSGFNGIVTDPVCVIEYDPAECISSNATPVGAPTFVSDIAASPGSGTAVVTWVTSVPASGTVLFGTTVQLGSSAGTSAMTTSQSVTLTGLKPRTLYHYRVQSTNASGNVVVSGDQTFTTTFLTPTPFPSRMPIGPGGLPVRSN
jgi:prepilin-type processing-associated H-X9-DG protein